jgi:hypothetical protein
VHIVADILIYLLYAVKRVRCAEKPQKGAASSKKKKNRGAATSEKNDFSEKS